MEVIVEVQKCSFEANTQALGSVRTVWKNDPFHLIMEARIFVLLSAQSDSQRLKIYSLERATRIHVEILVCVDCGAVRGLDKRSEANQVSNRMGTKRFRIQQ